MGNSEDKMTDLEMEFVVSRVQDNSPCMLQLPGQRSELVAVEKIFFCPCHVLYYYMPSQ